MKDQMEVMAEVKTGNIPTLNLPGSSAVHLGNMAIVMPSVGKSLGTMEDRNCPCAHPWATEIKGRYWGVIFGFNDAFRREMVLKRYPIFLLIL